MVIGIIAMLAALVSITVINALTKARNAAIKAEIDMLHTAIMNYKGEYGSLPPCYDGVTLTGTGAVGRHITRIFPRCTSGTIASQLTQLLTGKSPTNIVPTNAISFWLSGYTSTPTAPLYPGTRQKLFDFDMSRVDQTTGIYFPSKKPESPYIFIQKTEYGNSWPPSPFSYSINGQSFTIPANAYTALIKSGTYANPDSFQILCAGQDGVWSEDQNFNRVLDSGEDVNGNGLLDDSEDDLSNFWPGTRGDYIESLTN